MELSSGRLPRQAAPLCLSYVTSCSAGPLLPSTLGAGLLVCSGYDRRTTMSDSHRMTRVEERLEEHRRDRADSRTLAGSGVVDPYEGECPLEPQLDHILVRKGQAVGDVRGIILPDATAQKTRPNRGEVLAVGSGLESLVLERGDEVIYHEYGEVKLTYDSVEYVAIREKDVICRVKRDDG